MLRFKMTSRDVNAIPTQYRTWVVPNTPDFDGYYYTGEKSGPNPFVDTVAYAITDDNVIVDFNMPLPTTWIPPGLPTTLPILKTLPDQIADAQLAIIDGYAYMFGGQNNSKIYQAGINNPADWIDTGATLPAPLYGSSLAIVGSTIYLFGGDDGYSPVSTIYSASVSNPLSWVSAGSLPIALAHSSLGMYNGNLYLFGGYSVSGATNVILTASTSTPLAWSNTGSFIPAPTYGACLAQVNGDWLMYGGMTTGNVPTNTIWNASTTTPTTWLSDGYLPYQTAFSQFFTIGDSGYIIGPMVGSAPTGLTPILRCSLASPNSFTDTNIVVPGVISHSQLAIIADRIWFFGGSGSRAIFTCEQNVKYYPYDPTVLAYANATRVVLLGTDNADDPYLALGFPVWITDYVL